MTDPIAYAANSMANLGLATTRQLLEELKARGEVSATIGEYITHSDNMAAKATKLLKTLPDAMLDYSTVGGRQ